MPSNALALAPDEFGFTPTQFELIHGMLASSAPKDAGLTTQELGLFLTQCQRTGLDPLARQIYAIWRWDNVLRRPKMAIQVGIDGQRLVAERTGRYQGQDGPYWCGPDGQWVDVWLAETPPAAAKVGVYKQGQTKATYGVALYREYVQTNREGKPTPLWASMPTTMLAKCAESQALRKAFPQELSGLYTTEEMSQADTERPVIDVVPTEVPALPAGDPKPSPPLQRAPARQAQATPALVDASPEAAPRAPMSAPAGGGIVQPAHGAQVTAIRAELKRTGLGRAWLGKHEVTDVESLTEQGAAETLAELRQETDAGTLTVTALPYPEHAPAGEPAPITAFFERARGEWQTTRAQTRLRLDPNGLDDDLSDVEAVKAALQRFAQPITPKGLDRLFTLCSPAREAVTA